MFLILQQFFAAFYVLLRVQNIPEIIKKMPKIFQNMPKNHTSFSTRAYRIMADSFGGLDD